MKLSILYCGECDVIVAASPGLGLVAKCVAHTSGDAAHRGYVALRLPDADVALTDLADLTVIAAKYPKANHAAQLEPLTGSCP